MCAIENAIAKLVGFVLKMGTHVETAMLVHLNSAEAVAFMVAQGMCQSTYSRDFGGV